MRCSRTFRWLTGILGMLSVVLLMPGMGLADTFDVTIDKVKVGDNSSKSEPTEVSAAESDAIKINFSYDYDGDSDDISNISWSVYVDSATDGALMDQGTFSDKEGSSEFTTTNVLTQQDNQGKTRSDASNSLVYDYTVVVQAKYTERVYTNSSSSDDDDEDDDDDDDDDSTYTETEKTTSAQFKVIIDSDPPSDVETVGSAIPGENRLTISWEAVTTSQTGATETGVKYLFCVLETGNTTSADDDDDAVDGDDADGSEETSIELEAQQWTRYQDDDEDWAVKADEDGDVTDGDDIDGDEDGDLTDDDDDDVTDDDDDVTDDDDDVKPDDDDDDVTDDDDDVTDDDDDNDDVGEDIEGCMNPSPDGVSGTEHTITGLKNSVEYAIRIKAMDGAGNVSANWSEPIYGVPQPVDDFWEACQRDGCDEDGGFCFIATAAYGHYDDDEVRLLRHFRDDVLMSFSAGRSFVSYYYSVSPPLARELRQHPWVRSLTRAGLFPMVRLLDLAYNGSPVSQALALLGLLGLVLAGGLAVSRWRTQQ